MILNNRNYELETKTRPSTEQPAFEQKWNKILSQLDPITLEESVGAKLMKRTDTKFVFPSILLPAILDNLRPTYRILEVDNQVRLQHYQTLYFDTPDFQLYQQHHNGQRDRFKLRVRSYLNSEINYLEVKKKDNHNVTRKSRVETPFPLNGQSSEIKSFLKTTFPMSDMPMVPKITNQFYRISLVSRLGAERLTLDLNLRFFSPSGNFSIPGIVIAEIKQPHFSLQSPFVAEMRHAGYRPTRFSKYCIGTALAYPHLKRNAFKPLLLNLERLVLGGSY
ncbi:MAG: polyphosphate polymerase domain-containing protein [Anaerolineaceae bacterium]|nr:polyphosphate polymerase domain-containing protein [Anaerolineaceae bacterium]